MRVLIDVDTFSNKVNKLRDMRKIIENAISEYNKYHSPEAKTKLVSINNKSFKIEFTGSFCHTCGFYDYFEDKENLDAD